MQHKVREIIKYGADLIKICATGGVLSKGDDPNASQYTLEEMKAIVADAHRLGRKVAAHAHGAEGVSWASEAGVDSDRARHLMDDDAIATLKKNGTYLVPTLYLMDWNRENLSKRNAPDFVVRKMQMVSAVGQNNLKKAFAAGVKVAFGTDAAVYPHGLNAHEFAVYVRLGMTPLQAIQTATINAADLLGWSDKVGTLEPGKWADIIAVDGDPLQDVTTLRAGEVRDEGRRGGEERIRKVNVGRVPLPAERRPNYEQIKRPASQPASSFEILRKTKTTSWGRSRPSRPWRRGTSRRSWP